MGFGDFWLPEPRMLSERPLWSPSASSASSGIAHSPNPFPLWGDGDNDSTFGSPRTKRPLTEVTAMPLASPKKTGSKFARLITSAAENSSARALPAGSLDAQTGILSSYTGERIWCYGTERYKMLEKPLGTGQFNQARGFAPDQTITLHVLDSEGRRVEQTFRSQDIALKIVNPSIQHELIKKRDRAPMSCTAFAGIAKGYEYLTNLPAEDHFPVARMIAAPGTLINPATGFADLKTYVVERMAAPANSKMTQWSKVESVEDLPADERAFLDLVKKGITKIAVHGLANDKELYNDFAPGNIMFDSEDTAKIVDYTVPKSDWTAGLKQHLNSWACGNRVIFDYLADVGDCGQAGWSLHKHLGERFVNGAFETPKEINPIVHMLTTPLPSSSSPRSDALLKV